MTIQEKAKRAQSVIEFVKEGRRYEEAADLFGLSVGYVKLLCYKNGVKAIQGAKEKRNVDMQSYKEQGHSIQEVADRFGVTKSVAQSVCKGIAPQTDRKPKQYRNGYTKGDFDRDAYATKIVSERIPGFEYVDGFTSSDGSVRLRCKKCGAVIVRSWITVRHSKAFCDSCYKLSIEKEREQRKKIEADKKAWANCGKQKAKQLSFSVCGCCGSLFLPERAGLKYCSKECSEKAHYSVKKDRRIKKLKSICVDRNITLETLFKKSGGVCALCGGLCDWSDHTVKDDGSFVAGAMYPSIDHIKPISKGGLHEWKNVQLAHCRCNCLKSYKDYVPLPLYG